MNIFVLSLILKRCAKYHLNAHVTKMVIEYAQLLSSAHRVLDPDNCDDVMYKKTHVNHPCGIWVRESSENYKWLYNLFRYLCHEYTFRYGRVHLTETKLLEVLKRVPNGIPVCGMTNFKLAMPDECKIYFRDGSPNAVASYRNYYVMKKAHICVWSVRTFGPDKFEEPLWYLKGLDKAKEANSAESTDSDES